MIQHFCDSCKGEVLTMVFTLNLVTTGNELAKQFHLCPVCHKNFKSGGLRLEFLPSEGTSWPQGYDSATSIPS